MNKKAFGKSVKKEDIKATLEHEALPKNTPGNTLRLNNKTFISPSFSDLLKGGMGCESVGEEVGVIKTPRIKQLRAKSQQRLLNIH